MIDNIDFTIITTSYNDERNIGSYFEHITAQTLFPKELIVVDGGSSDKTIEYLKEISHKCPFPVRIIQKGRLNIAQAFNLGIKESCTKYVLITCMGNTFSNSMCADLYKLIVETDADASYGLLLGINSGKFSRLYNSCFLSPTGIDIMSNRCVMYSRSVFDRIGFFVEDFIYAGEDAEFLQRFDRMGLSRVLFDKPTVFWETPNSYSQFLKQRKDYTIAELQYHDLKDVFSRHIVKRLFEGSVILMMLFIWLIPLLFLFVMLRVCFRFLRLILYRGNIKEAALLFVTPFINAYFIISNLLVLGEYRVNK